MSEVKKIATRESYGNALVELGKKYDDVVVIYDHYQVVQLSVSCKHCCLPHLTFLNFSIPDR